jgi:hypothetical protein
LTTIFLTCVAIVGVGYVARLVFRDEQKAVVNRFLDDPMMTTIPTGYSAATKPSVEISNNPEESGPVGETVSKSFTADHKIETLTDLVKPWTEPAAAGGWTLVWACRQSLANDTPVAPDLLVVEFRRHEKGRFETATMHVYVNRPNLVNLTMRRYDHDVVTTPTPIPSESISLLQRGFEPNSIDEQCSRN